MRGSWILVGLVLSAGCASPVPSEPTEAQDTVLATPPVVIAVIDSGTIPSLPIFKVDDDAYVRDSVPADLVSVDLSPNPSADAADAENQDAFERNLTLGTLYHYRGTRLLGISFEAPGGSPTHDFLGHGAMTTYLAARDARASIIVSVQVNNLRCENGDPTCTRESVAEGMEWIASQDWIDIVSVSLGTFTGKPDPFADPSFVRLVEATRDAVDSGKLIVTAAGNAVVIPAPLASWSGPPWVVNVGGFEQVNQGETLIANKGVDVVANFSDLLPFGPSEMTWQTGTSFAAPVVAGTLANAIALARQTEPDREFNQQELRNALNATATLDATPLAWDPVPPPGGGYPVNPARASLPILAQPQMGWGYVHAGLAPEIARRVIEQDFSVPAGKEEAALFQPAWQKAREEYWERNALGASGHGAYSLSST